MSRIIPILSIVETFKWPEEKTMALGGVATGSIKAREAEMVAGKRKVMG